MQVAVLLLDSFVATEAVGAFDVLHRIPGIDVQFVGLARGPVRDRTKALSINVSFELEDVPAPAVVVVPGGLGVFNVLEDPRLLRWLRDAHRTSRWTASVGAGALLLARAGILDGVEATTHWAAMDELAQMGVRTVAHRVVERGKILTAAGNTASIDMALRLAERMSDPVTAAAIQLWIEYDPEPPYDSGSLATASDRVVARTTELLDR